jgi:hypothetical protein
MKVSFNYKIKTDVNSVCSFVASVRHILVVAVYHYSCPVNIFLVAWFYECVTSRDRQKNCVLTEIICSKPSIHSVCF